MARRLALPGGTDVVGTLADQVNREHNLGDSTKLPILSANLRNKRFSGGNSGARI
jgi:hypothetical protein